jgi:tRNA threonylcarbamoyladenosine biosynthesis protein TsaE
MKTANRTTSSIFETASAAETMKLAARMARRLKGGEIILLRGPIGAGKTVFVQGLAKALGMTAQPVSASFNLMREYHGPQARMFHIDLFRLEEKDMANLGIEEILEDETAIIAAEWPDPATDLLPPDRLEIDITLRQGDARKIKLRAAGPRSEALLKL